MGNFEFGWRLTKHVIGYWLGVSWAFLMSFTVYGMIMLAIAMASVALFFVIREMAETDNRESAFLTVVFVGGIAGEIIMWHLFYHS
jgi:hypothetical protein